MGLKGKHWNGVIWIFCSTIELSERGKSLRL
jgi:hypothetical protein